MIEMTRFHDTRASAHLISSWTSTYVMCVSLWLSTWILPLITPEYAQAAPDETLRSEPARQSRPHTSAQNQGKPSINHEAQAPMNTQSTSSIQLKTDTPSTEHQPPDEGRLTKSPSQRPSQRVTHHQTDEPADVSMRARSVTQSASQIATQKEIEGPEAPSCAVIQTSELKSHLRMIQVVGMECEFCVRGIRDRLRRLTGVQGVQVNLKSGEVNVTVHAHNPPPTEELCEAVRGAGYQVQAIRQPPTLRLVEKQRVSSISEREHEKKSAHRQSDNQGHLRGSQQSLRVDPIVEAQETAQEEPPVKPQAQAQGAHREGVQGQNLKEPQESAQDKLHEADLIPNLGHLKETHTDDPQEAQESPPSKAPQDQGQIKEAGVESPRDQIHKQRKNVNTDHPEQERPAP